MLQQLLAIFLVLGLLIGTLYLLRRRGLARFSGKLARVGGRPKQMQVLEKIALSPQHSLHLVNVRNTVFLIGVSPSGCTKIGLLPRSGSAAEFRERG
ncbi:MAG: flagellar biosynthetic protein FliO [Acidobacteriaceae bacterium]|nr:flagellar biosynthetic protein FliO [Acidobacteriaceae bacterium]